MLRYSLLANFLLSVSMQLNKIDKQGLLRRYNVEMLHILLLTGKIRIGMLELFLDNKSTILPCQW